MGNLKEILWSAIGIIGTGLATWLVSLLVSWLNSKIKNENLRKWAVELTTIITDGVKSVFQSFVSTMKENDKFDEKAQQTAKQKALEIIVNELTPELKEYITANYGDMTTYLNNQIEAIIYNLKNTSTAK